MPSPLVPRFPRIAALLVLVPLGTSAAQQAAPDTTRQLETVVVTAEEDFPHPAMTVCK